MSDTYTITPLTTPDEHPAILCAGHRMTIHDVCRALNRMHEATTPKPYTDRTRWRPSNGVNSVWRIKDGVVLFQTSYGGWAPSSKWNVCELLADEQRGNLIRTV